ncbi:glycyl-tRNA synthetase beta chain [Nitrosospira multiformis]|uniref:Glycine--tRNA ligase beta subunit n=1 Tax=Nitrosospira multiformis TaxID=1231 RepID=A0A1I0AVT1_9PROT|nr:glycyl-tRNA synthetase beta chain [Nitrosospira multiformis]
MGAGIAGESRLTDATQGSATRNLLVELLVEELPPKSLKKLGDSFAQGIAAGLKRQGLAREDATATPFASPRRLAVHLTCIAAQAPDTSSLKKLMPVAVGLDENGQPTAALLKKLRSLCGDTDPSPFLSQLKRAHDGKTETLFLDSVAKGATLAEGLQAVLDETLEKLPIARMMTYQLADGWNTVNFVRPAHALVALHGKEVVDVSILGLTAGRQTQGHRFEAMVSPLTVKDADSYEHQLQEEGAVIASFSHRRAEVERQLLAAAGEEDLGLTRYDGLLDEVAALVERPRVLMGEFETGFLDVPQECLILTMQANQKYFPLLDAGGQLSHRFLIVSNIRPVDGRTVIAGNERVLRSRLADAKFFFDQDRRKTLASRVEGLQRVVYHNKLGTQAERVERIWAIAQTIGLQLGGNELAARAGEAAMLAKADLLTDMVGEFPELQGIMGRYYAKHDGVAEEVADAIEDHYKPRFAGDELPRNPVGVCVALADKLETLVGLFGIGQIPTGDKDPFALRRHALGVIRILIEKEAPLALNTLLEQTADIFGQKIKGSTETTAETATETLSDFIYERLKHYFSAESIEGQATNFGEPGNEGRLAFSPQQIDAVLALRPQLLNDVKKRLIAVRAFAALPEAESLAATNKRVGNILRKAEVDEGGEIDTVLLQAPAEQALHEALNRIMPEADAAFAAGDYTASLQALAALKVPVDRFFDTVMVNTEDTALRHNRLALLAQMQKTMNRIADISRLAL